jgi:hypothetical protein
VRRGWLTPLAFVLVFALAFVRMDRLGFDWIWIYRWTLLYGVTFVLLAYRLYSLLGAWPACAFLYFSLHGLIYSQATPLTLPAVLEQIPGRMSIDDGLNVLFALKQAAALSLPFVVVVPFLLVSYRHVLFDRALPLALLGLATVISVAIIGWGDKFEIPITHLPSITATWLGLMIAMLPKKGMGRVLTVLYLAAILKTKAATGMLTAAVALAAKYWRTLWFWLACVLFAPVAWLWVLPKLQDGNGRFPVWKIAVNVLSARPWFGWGQGSTGVIIPLAQVKAGYVETDAYSFFMFLHNDWLEIALTTGLVGAAFALALFYQGLKARQDRAALLALGAAMVTNFPLHYPLSALTAVVILGRVFHVRQRT